MIATLFYEEDIVNSGGSVNLRRKVKSGIFSDSYEADIVMSGTKIPAIIKLYHNGSGRIVELLKYESKDNELTLNEVMRVRKTTKNICGKRQAYRRVSTAILIVAYTVYVSSLSKVLRAGAIQQSMIYIVIMMFILLIITKIVDIYKRGIPENI